MSGPHGVPPVVQAWVTQLLDPKFVQLVELALANGGQVDVRLSSAGGKVRVEPAVVLNGGQQTMVEPLTMLTALRSTG